MFKDEQLVKKIGWTDWLIDGMIGTYALGKLALGRGDTFLE